VEIASGGRVASAFHSVFETERRGAISPIVAQLWTPREAAGGSRAPLDSLYQEPRRGGSNEGS